MSATCVTGLDACKMQRKSACLAVNTASKNAPRVFTAGNVGACIDKTNAVYAKTLGAGATQADIDAMNDVCAYVFQGNSTSACTVKYDCKDKSQICDKGICAKPMTVAKGAFCVSPGQVCSSDSYCAPDPATQNTLKCLPKAALNAPCSATVPCIDPYRCDATGTCMPKLMQAELCGSSADCSSTVPYCDPYAGCKCDPGLRFANGANTCVDYGGGPGVTPPCGAGSSPDAGTTSNTDASSGG